MTAEDAGKFRDELEELVNRYNRENESNTPDFILAQYIDGALKAFDDAVQARDKWYGYKSYREDTK